GWGAGLSRASRAWGSCGPRFAEPVAAVGFGDPPVGDGGVDGCVEQVLVPAGDVAAEVPGGPAVVGGVLVLVEGPGDGGGDSLDGVGGGVAGCFGGVLGPGVVGDAGVLVGLVVTLEGLGDGVADGDAGFPDGVGKLRVVGADVEPVVEHGEERGCFAEMEGSV